MSRQILNRREDVYVNETPPEILTEAKLSADGYVKNTEYPTSSKAGVIKAATSYGTTVTSQGFLGAQTRTAEQYEGDANTLFVGKGTLENVFQPKAMEVWRNLMLVGAGVLDPDALPVGTVISDLILTKTADGYVFSATKTEPETP